MAQHNWHWFRFIFYINQLVSSVDASSLIYACAEKDGVGKSLGKFSQNSVCRKTVNCDFDKRSLKGLYLNFALIVTNGRWQETVLLESALSSCGITNFVSSGLTDKAPNMTQMCRSDHNTAVFTFKSNQIQSYMNDTTCHTRNSNSSTFIDNLLSTCPNTLWIDEHDSPCKSSATYSAIRLHRLGPSNVTIADGTEEKDLLFGKTLIATSIPYSPFFNKAVDENGIVSYTGIIVEMMDKIASKLHFNYSLVEPYDGNAGILINGSWNGMIRMLQDKDVDIAAAPLTIGELRNTVVDFSSTFYFEDIGIMIKRPDERNTLWRMFSLFPNIMWGYILIIAAFSTLVIYILHKFFPIPLNTGFESFNACGWYVFSCLSNQGGEQDPVTWSAVIFLTAFWLFVFAIISVYSGGLIAMLTTNRMALPFSNLQELADAIIRKEYKVCLQGNTQIHQTILKSDLNEYVTVRKFLSENHGFDTTEDNCVKLITNQKQNNLAFIAETTRLIEIQRQFCTKISFIILNERFFPGYFSFALQKNSPLNALISMEITDLMQYGLIDEWKRKYQEPTKFCHIAQPNDIISAESKPLTVRAIGGPCLLFLVGLVLSATMFMWEFDEPISYISFDVNGEDAYVSGYVTSPGHRGVGVGSALWAYMMGQLKYVTNIGIGFTCAEKDGVGKSLGKFFQNSVCRKTANCDFDKRSLKSLYLNFALIVTNGRWQDTVLLESALSSCGITNFVSSGLTDKAPNMMQMCRSDHNTAVFTFKSNQIQSYMNDTTCHTRNSNSSTFIDNLLSTCPNTLWIDEPDNPCKSSATYSAFRLHRLGPSNVTIADGTEEKDLLFGKTLIATSVLYSPFFNKAVDENGIVSYTGIIVEMMDKIASKLHFNYSLVEPYDGNAGILINGSWNGMIRMLQDKDVDIAAAPLTIGALRNTVVDFSSTFYFEDIGIMIKRPDERNTLWRMFSLFPNIMWGYILITAAFSTLVIYILHKFFPIPLNTGFESFNACGWYVFSCLSNQGGEQDPVTWSAVIFLTAFWLFVFAIISVYSGGLIAMLTTNRMALPFSNLQELAEAISRKEYKVCLQGNTQLHQTILKSDLNEYVTVRKFLSENHGFDTTEDNCVKLITNPKQNNLAFIAETTRLIEVQRQFCTNISFIILNERFFPGYFSFALQKNSPLNALISMEITDLLQYGLIDEWKRKYQEPIKFCRIAQPNDVISTKTKPLTVRAIGGPCLLFLVGLVLSATMFMWEYGIFHCCHRKTKLTVVEIKSAVHD